MRIGLAVLVVAVSVIACSDSSTTAPQPPNMLGNWSGTRLFVTTTAGVVESNTCNEAWIINAQSGTKFSGSFTGTGGTIITCSLGGIVTGTVSVTGAVTNLTTTPTIGGSDAPNCTRASGDVVFSGSISGNTLTAQKNDVQQCAAGLVNRTVTVTLNKN
jgi:hypothetical protein